MKRIAIIAVLCLLGTVAVAYVCDTVALTYRLPRNRIQYATVMVQKSYVIPMKDGKTQYSFDPPAPQECVNALFPHNGDPPCWYLSRHTKQQVNTGDR